MLTFPKGLYGFEEATKFLFVPTPEASLPFFYLVCLDVEDLQFVVTNPFYFIENYDFELADTTAEALDIKGLEDVSIYNLVVILDDVNNTTINLKAPLVINHREMKGAQLILKEDYAYKHLLFTKEGDV